MRDEAVTEPGRPAPQRRLGVDAPGPGQHDRRREQVAERGLGPAGVRGAQRVDRDRGPVERLGVVAGREPDRRGLAVELVRVEQRRQAGADAVDDRVRALLRLLDLLPVGHHLGDGVRGDVAEDVRVAADELVVDAAGDVGDRERAGLLGEHRVEHHLVQQVAELVLEPRVVRRSAPGRRARPPGAPRSPRRPRRPPRAGSAASEWCVCSASHGQPPGPRSRSDSATQRRELAGDRGRAGVDEHRGEVVGLDVAVERLERHREHVLRRESEPLQHGDRRVGGQRLEQRELHVGQHAAG